MAKFGSLDNILMNNGNVAQVEVGMKVTILHWTDRDPGFITEIVRKADGSIKGVKVQEVEWKIDNPFSGYAEAIYEDKPKGEPQYFKVTTHGRLKGRIPGLSLGTHDPYRDPSF